MRRLQRMREEPEAERTRRCSAGRGAKQLEAGRGARWASGGELQGLAQHDLPQLELQPDQP
ncbi:MAG: hypothetical protein IPH71_05835 [Proteobacteria bacterium]|nr:hypothetical protein [Pseudomonadota bacterium]